MNKNFFNFGEDSPDVPRDKSKYRVTCRCGAAPCKKIFSVTLTTGERFVEGEYLPSDAPISDIADLLANHGNAIEREE
jgi:hypothetical protein